MRFRRTETAETSENATESEPLSEDEDAAAETPVEEVLVLTDIRWKQNS